MLHCLFTADIHLKLKLKLKLKLTNQYRDPLLQGCEAVVSMANAEMTKAKKSKTDHTIELTA